MSAFLVGRKLNTSFSIHGWWWGLLYMIHKFSTLLVNLSVLNYFKSCSMYCFASFPITCGFFLYSTWFVRICRWFQKVCCWVDIVILNLPNTSDMHLSELALCVLSYHWLYLIERASGAREHFGNRIVHCLILLQIKKRSGGVMLWVAHLASFCQYFQWTNWAFSCCCQCFNISLHKHFYLHDSQGIILEYSNLEC